MTQDEVDMIYDYFHDNYEYKNGYFYNKDGNKIEGYLDIKSPRLHFRLKFRINKKPYNINYCKAAWIYHYKENVKYIGFKDGNSSNIHIDNLYKSSMSNLHKDGNHNSKNKHDYKGVVQDSGKFYGTMYINYKKFYSKACDTSKEAYIEYLKMKENYENYKALSEKSN